MHGSSSLWKQITLEAISAAREDSSIHPYLLGSIIEHSSLEEALARRLASKLAEPQHSFETLYNLTAGVLAEPTILSSIVKDIEAIVERDPACSSVMAAYLNYKGFLALTAYRISHRLWMLGRKYAAYFIQARVAEVWSVDIHPAARLGCGIFIDHGTGLVIGETAVVEDCVSLLHGVTLGGTGKHHGDRHPKIRKGVLIGAGAKILGNVEVGAGARIGAGSVVLSSVPPHSTAVGVPARIIPQPETMAPALEMDHSNWII